MKIHDTTVRIPPRRGLRSPPPLPVAALPPLATLAPPRPNKRSVYGLVASRVSAGNILTELKAAGIAPAEVSLLYVRLPVRRGGEGRAGPAAALEVAVALPVGGSRAASNWIPGVGPLLLPGSEPLIAAGPLAAALRARKGKSIATGLAAFGIPVAESARYEAGIREGGVLLAVHDSNPEASGSARQIFRAAGATHTFTLMEVLPRRLLGVGPAHLRRFAAA